MGVLASLSADVLDCKSSDLGLTPDRSRVWDFYPSAKSFQTGINIRALLSATSASVVCMHSMHKNTSTSTALVPHKKVPMSTFQIHLAVVYILLPHYKCHKCDSV